jgi:hypothetical protein
LALPFLFLYVINGNQQIEPCATIDETKSSRFFFDFDTPVERRNTASAEKNRNGMITLMIHSFQFGLIDPAVKRALKRVCGIIQ